MEQLKRLIAPAAILGAIVAAWFGDFPGEAVMTANVPDIGGLIHSSAAHPNFVIGLVGIFVGLYVIPLIVRSLSWTGDRDAFRARLATLYQQHKQQFHTLLNQAYSRWRDKQPRLPIKLDDLVDRGSVPLRSDLVSEDISRIEPALTGANKMLWLFCFDLLEQIQKAANDAEYKPSLLSPPECAQFTAARKALTDFWDVEARRIYSGVGVIFHYLWLRELKSTLKDRALLELPYLETALAKQLKYNVGATYLLRLSAHAFELWHTANILPSGKPATTSG